MAQNPTNAARHEAIANLDAQVDADYAARKVDPETPQAPQPKPVKPLSKLAQQRITEAMFHAQWSYEQAYECFKND